MVKYYCEICQEEIEHILFHFFVIHPNEDIVLNAREHSIQKMEVRKW